MCCVRLWLYYLVCFPCCLCLWCCFFFFFKQKTAYEMRISDWSSDVCSSDLLGEGKIATSPVMSRLSELMFVEAVRRYATALPAEQRGWLAGVRDTFIGRALALIHGKINHPWTAGDLANEVALSRSAFSDRFTSLVGVPPKRYITSWRMQVAKDALRRDRPPLPQTGRTERRRGGKEAVRKGRSRWSHYPSKKK